MAMLLIKGSYRIVGAAPDGDSVRFYPDDPDEWDLVPGQHPVQRNASGGAQLRLDGIDALETHYSVTGAVLHQPLEFAHKAAAGLLKWLGFTNVVRDADETVVEATPRQQTGFILTRNADLYGRCVALAGRGKAPAASATNVFVDAATVRQTANYHLLQRGLAYPTFYRNLFPDLRATMAKAAQQAQAAPRGLWPWDHTRTGVKVATIDTVVDEIVMWPKLFRRLVDYLVLSDDDVSLAGFSGYLAQRADRYTILSTGHPTTGLDLVVKVNGQTLKLTRPYEDLMFEER
jgi:endonuclease YncB( thermonuclease family)